MCVDLFVVVLEGAEMNFYKDCWICPYAEYNYEFEKWQCLDVSQEGIKCYVDHEFEGVSMIGDIPDDYMR